MAGRFPAILESRGDVSIYFSLGEVRERQRRERTITIREAIDSRSSFFRCLRGRCSIYPTSHV